MHPNQWLEVTPTGLRCIPGDFMIDPTQPAKQAVVTHGHADHARAGHGLAVATPETIAIMQCRYGQECAATFQPQRYHETFDFGPVRCYLLPAGHILGSAQLVMEYKGARAIVSGDYKRRRDATCAPFEAESCDVFISEATFALPVFRHPPLEQEIAKLVQSLSVQGDRCHLIGAYALGKCQRVIKGLRNAGYKDPIYLHGAQVKLCNLYQSLGIDLGELIPVSQTDKKQLGGKVVLAPPSALEDRWSRSLPNVLPIMASGWMQVRARAKQKGVELPLVISDHADWDELIATVEEINPGELWVTHGRDDALIHWATQQGRVARPLHLLGYDDDDDEISEAAA